MTSVGTACKMNKPGYYGKGSIEPFAGIDTVYDVLQYVAKTHDTCDALGWCDIVDIHEEAKEVTKTVDGKEVKETKKWKYFQLSGYKYITYIGLKDQVNEIVRGLVDLGLTTDDVCNIYAATRWVSFLVSFASVWGATRLRLPFVSLSGWVGPRVGAQLFGSLPVAVDKHTVEWGLVRMRTASPLQRILSPLPPCCGACTAPTRCCLHIHVDLARAAPPLPTGYSTFPKSNSAPLGSVQSQGYGAAADRGIRVRGMGSGVNGTHAGGARSQLSIMWACDGARCQGLGDEVTAANQSRCVGNVFTRGLGYALRLDPARREALLVHLI
ncbi:hypothetical protein B0H16DRAFT_1475282 [Mycena metata]|uniref:Uncharacterized protein n=1 Tax=Mycena metata TaxID=1033252 RepID=A0AAD7HEJ1_9AGAR|nr:hypothetical protein B0H16DRAFT_1475282 [Mycena metata]